MQKKKLINILIFLLISLSILFINHLPDYFAFLNTPKGLNFSGQASWFDPWDINIYVSAIRSGQTNGLLLANNYTSAPNKPVIYYPLYTLTGLLLPQFNPYLLFHTLAAAFGFVLLFTIWKLSKIFLGNDKRSFVALLLIALGGGAGWILSPNIQAADLYMTGFTFSSHFQRAHEALGVTLYLLSLIYFYLATKNNKISLALISTLSLITLTFFYPFYILSFFLIGGVCAALAYFKNGNKKSLFFLAGEIAATGIIVFLYFQHLKTNPTFNSVLSQNLSTPNILEIFFGLGILVPILIYAWRTKKTEPQQFLYIWLIVSLLLSFLPLGFARFYLRTIFFPVVILSLIGLESFSKKTKLPHWILIAGLLILMPLSQLFTTYKRIAEIGNNNPWYYLSNSQSEVLNFMKDNLKPGSVILSSYTLGNRIPAVTQSKVYFGHLIQTPNAQEKINNLALFYSQNIATESAREFLDRENIDFVIFGPEEKLISEQYDKKSALDYPFLKAIFSTSETTIFSKVKSIYENF